MDIQTDCAGIYYLCSALFNTGTAPQRLKASPLRKRAAEWMTPLSVTLEAPGAACTLHFPPGARDGGILAGRVTVCAGIALLM